MQGRAAMVAELADVRSQIVDLRRELGLPVQGPLPTSLPQAAPAAMNTLPRTLTEEGRQVQAAIALSSGSGPGTSDASGPPTRSKVKRQVSGIDGMRTMSPQNSRSTPAMGRAASVEEAEEREEDGDGEDFAPLTRQVSGPRGMHMTELGLPVQPSKPSRLPQTAPAAANLLPRTLTEEERQVQAAIARSSGSEAARSPGKINIKRQVSGIDGMRTMSPQNPRSTPVVGRAASVEEVEEREEDDDGEDFAPLTRQVSGPRGMHMAAFHR